MTQPIPDEPGIPVTIENTDGEKVTVGRAWHKDEHVTIVLNDDAPGKLRDLIWPASELQNFSIAPPDLPPLRIQDDLFRKEMKDYPPASGLTRHFKLREESKETLDGEG